MANEVNLAGKTGQDKDVAAELQRLREENARLQGEIAGRCVTEPQGLACIPTDPNHRPGEEGGPAFGLR